MKDKFNIQAVNKLLLVVGCALLLLISPCTIRNFVQTELGIPSTEVTNISKTTLTNTTCNAVQKTDLASVGTNLTVSSTFLLTENTIACVFIAFELTNQLAGFYTKGKQSLSLVPLYILHKNFKAYL